VILSYALRKGSSKCCGAPVHRVRSLVSNKYQNTRTYGCWVALKHRCTSPNSVNWANYGGRGITVCERWKKFENFFEDMGECPSKAHSIDRIDNDGPYSPENCRWSTRKEQSRNTRSNFNVTFQGKTQTLMAWVEELGLTYATISGRIHQLGWTPEEALSIPCVKGAKPRRWHKRPADRGPSKRRYLLKEPTQEG